MQQYPQRKVRLYDMSFYRNPCWGWWSKHNRGAFKYYVSNEGEGGSNSIFYQIILINENGKLYVPLHGGPRIEYEYSPRISENVETSVHYITSWHHMVFRWLGIIIRDIQESWSIAKGCLCYKVPNMARWCSADYIKSGLGTNQIRYIFWHAVVRW